MKKIIVDELVCGGNQSINQSINQKLGKETGRTVSGDILKSSKLQHCENWIGYLKENIQITTWLRSAKRLRWILVDWRELPTRPIILRNMLTNRFGPKDKKVDDGVQGLTLRSAKTPRWILVDWRELPTGPIILRNMLTNRFGPKDKKVDDGVQGLTLERRHKQTICVKRRRKRTRQLKIAWIRRLY